jgi:hypothetical protein
MGRTTYPFELAGAGAVEAGFGTEEGEESVCKLTEIEPDTAVATPITRSAVTDHRITPIVI